MGKNDIDIVTDINGLEGDVFVGAITDVKVGKSNPNQPDQVYITVVMDVDHFDDPYELYIPYNPKRRSVWGVWLTALRKEAGIKIDTPKDLVGSTLKFDRRDIVFGDFTAKENFPIPIQDLTEGD